MNNFTLRINDKASTHITRTQLIELNSYGLLERNEDSQINFVAKRTVKLIRPELQCRGYSARYPGLPSPADLKDDPNSLDLLLAVLADMRRGSPHKATKQPGWVSNAIRPFRAEVTVIQEAYAAV